MTAKKISFHPQTILGKWSAGLIISFILLILLANVVVQVQGPRADQTFFSNPLVSLPMFLALGCAISSFVTGLLAVFREKERGIAVFLATFIGLLVLFFVVGEITVPH
jgi:integral membrane sensor domain MASE1